MNKANSLFTTIFRYTLRVLLIELGLALVVGVALFLIEHTLKPFGDWMFWAGLIILAVGLSSLLGGMGITRGGLYQIGQTVGDQDVSTRTRTDLREERASFSFLYLSAGVGILAMIIGGLFQGGS